MLVLLVCRCSWLSILQQINAFNNNNKLTLVQVAAAEEEVEEEEEEEVAKHRHC